MRCQPLCTLQMTTGSRTREAGPGWARMACWLLADVFFGVPLAVEFPFAGVLGHVSCFGPCVLTVKVTKLVRGVLSEAE